MPVSTISPQEPGATLSSLARPAQRIASIDVVRGVVMILMAIDHVRVYSGLPPGGPTPGIFFTRWVTHFCAPAFVFFAGTGAYLHGRKLAGPGSLGKFLLTRGVWLLLLELFVIRVAWTFNLDFAHYLLAGVIWMLGWCMILLAGLVRLPIWVIATFGVTVMAAQSIFHWFARATPPSLRWLWQLLYLGGPIKLGQNGPFLFVLYNLVPWIGVMAAGYAFGTIMTREPAQRDRLCFRIGVTATALFLLLGGLALFLLPTPQRPEPWLFRLLEQSKYRDSQLFLLMTLGPAIALLPLAQRARGRIAEAITIFGRVPLFYYLLHIPLIHVAACVVSLIREGSINPWLFANHPMAPGPVPAGYMWSLALLYLVFALCIALLYFPCRWYARLKAARKSRWLSYL